MEIAALISRPVAAKESVSSPQMAEGASFLGSMAEAARVGQIVVAGSTEFAKLDLLKNKFGIDMPVTYSEESDEEKIYGFLTKIRRILEDSKNK